MNTKKIFINTVALFLFLTIIIGSIPALASDSAELLDLTVNGTKGSLRDGSFNTYSKVTSALTLSSAESISSIYIIFRNEAVPFTVSDGSSSVRFENNFLQYYAKLEKISSNTVTLTFDKEVNICDIYAFKEGTLPDFVHQWELPHEKADLLLFSSHADDEQLFFAGVLPYYAGAMGYRVQVTYFTDHINEPGRRQELLNGLWTVGVRNYPVISNFPDEYSESYDWALSNLKKHGFTEDDVIAHQTEQIRRFKPLVIVGHDLNGEYGHGQHMLNSEALIKAVEAAKDASMYTASAQSHGTWDTPKLYLHLYEKDPIVMNWDIPLDAFDGKTAFQMTQQGFLCHKSQQFTWFNEWMNGKAKDRTMASQITHLSPCNYGLYRTTVGADTLKNDFFENITIYAEQERIAAEEEAKRLEEEKRRQDEESRRAEESRLAEESNQTELGTNNTTATDNTDSLSTEEAVFFAVIIVVAVTTIISVLSVFSSKSKKKKR